MNKFPFHNLKNLNDNEKLNYINNWFKENFICDRNGCSVKIYTHDGKRVIFQDIRESHAYTKENSLTKKREIDYVRLRYIHLIGKTINLVGNVIFKTGKDNKHNKIRRWYLETKKNHLVILQELKSKNFIFISQHFIQDYRMVLKTIKFIGSP